jgi:hypothetical protein
LYGVTALATGSAWSVGIEIEVSSSGATSPASTLIDHYIP